MAFFRCPNCGSSRSHRSKIRRWFFRLIPYRTCDDCNKRYRIGAIISGWL